MIAGAVSVLLGLAFFGVSIAVGLHWPGDPGEGIGSVVYEELGEV